MDSVLDLHWILHGGLNIFLGPKEEGTRRRFPIFVTEHGNYLVCCY